MQHIVVPSHRYPVIFGYCGPVADQCFRSRRHMRIRASFLKSAVLVLLLCLPSLLRAQNQASVTGVVTDPSGAVIPNAGVTLSNPSTGLEYNAVTNSAG